MTIFKISRRFPELFPPSYDISQRAWKIKSSTHKTDLAVPEAAMVDLIAELRHRSCFVEQAELQIVLWETIDLLEKCFLKSKSGRALRAGLSQ